MSETTTTSEAIEELEQNVQQLESELASVGKILPEDDEKAVTQKLAKREVLPYRIRGAKVALLEAKVARLERRREELLAQATEYGEEAEKLRIEKIELEERWRKTGGMASNLRGSAHSLSTNIRQLKFQIRDLEKEQDNA